MDDRTIPQLFDRQDAHLARLDAQLAATTETLSRQNAQLTEATQMLAATRREVEALHAEASRRFEETMRASRR